jgi:hypothetical protein
MPRKRKKIVLGVREYMGHSLEKAFPHMEKFDNILLTDFYPLKDPSEIMKDFNSFKDWHEKARLQGKVHDFPLFARKQQRKADELLKKGKKFFPIRRWPSKLRETPEPNKADELRDKFDDVTRLFYMALEDGDIEEATQLSLEQAHIESKRNKIYNQGILEWLRENIHELEGKTFMGIEPSSTYLFHTLKKEFSEKGVDVELKFLENPRIEKQFVKEVQQRKKHFSSDLRNHVSPHEELLRILSTPGEKDPEEIKKLNLKKVFVEYRLNENFSN